MHQLFFLLFLLSTCVISRPRLPPLPHPLPPLHPPRHPPRPWLLPRPLQPPPPCTSSLGTAGLTPRLGCSPYPEVEAPSLIFGSLLPSAGTDFSPTSVIQTKHNYSLSFSLFYFDSLSFSLSLLFTSLRIHFRLRLFFRNSSDFVLFHLLVVLTTCFAKLTFYAPCFFSSSFSVSRSFFSSLLIPLFFFRLFYLYSLSFISPISSLPRQMSAPLRLSLA